MLAVALNYLGSIQERELGPLLINFFNEFKMIRLSPCGDREEGRLQICQPQGHEELMKNIQISWNPAESLLELRGPKDKLQRTVRYMLYFDEKKKYKQVFLEGDDGINDFPWAIQIAVIQLPVWGWEYDPEVIRKSDVIVINSSDKEENENFIAKVKKLDPDIPIFLEKLQEGLSQDIKDCLKVLFAKHVEKRARIKEKLESQHPHSLISCAQACRLSGELGVSSFLLGSVCDELGYRITNCRLGCF